MNVMQLEGLLQRELERRMRSADGFMRKGTFMIADNSFIGDGYNLIGEALDDRAYSLNFIHERICEFSIGLFEWFKTMIDEYSPWLVFSSETIEERERVRKNAGLKVVSPGHVEEFKESLSGLVNAMGEHPVEDYILGWNGDFSGFMERVHAAVQEVGSREGIVRPSSNGSSRKNDISLWAKGIGACYNRDLEWNPLVILTGDRDFVRLQEEWYGSLESLSEKHDLLKPRNVLHVGHLTGNNGWLEEYRAPPIIKQMEEKEEPGTFLG